MSISLSDVVGRPDGKLIITEAGSTPYSLEGMVSVQPSTLTLPADGGLKSLRLSCMVPKSAKGGYYGRLLLKARSDVGEYVLEDVVPVDVELVVQGTVETAARIIDVDIVAADDKIVASVALVNNGNVMLRPTGEVKIQDMRLEEVRAFKLPESPVLPGGTVILQSSCPVVPEDKYSITILVDYGSESEKLYWSKEIDLP